MPPRGKTTSPWWTHFQPVEGCTMYIFKGSLWIIRWLPSSKMPTLWHVGETGQTWMHCKRDYKCDHGIPHEDQAQRPCYPGDALLCFLLLLQSLLSPGAVAQITWKMFTGFCCESLFWLPRVLIGSILYLIKSWVPISKYQVPLSFGHSACRKIRQDTVG